MKAHRPPSGPLWLHEIKHDGFRVVARKDGQRVRLYSRPGNDLTWRDRRGTGAACVPDPASFMARPSPATTTECPASIASATGGTMPPCSCNAFDLIELNGDDLRRDPLDVRKPTLASVVAKGGPGIRYNEHIEGDGEAIFRHACKLRLEGIVSKRKDLPYRSGRSPDWLKFKNLAAPAVKREAEEDWEMAINYRTHFAYRIDLWDADGENVIEHLAGVEDPQVAMATYVAACQRWPRAPITLRQGSRVIEDSRRTRLV